MVVGRYSFRGVQIIRKTGGLISFTGDFLSRPTCTVYMSLFLILCYPVRELDSYRSPRKLAPLVNEFYSDISVILPFGLSVLDGFFQVRGIVMLCVHLVSRCIGMVTRYRELSFIAG